MTGKKFSDKEYKHVLKVWDRFEMMKHYHDFYLRRDVLLLANMFEKSRYGSLKNYGLWQSHYLNAPALSWDEMPCMTKIELELIWDVDMYLFFEKTMRDGVSYIFKRYSKAKVNI